MYPSYAICGGCGRRYIDHNFEDGEDYCNLDTDNTFMDEPLPYDLLEFIERLEPGISERAIRLWRSENNYDTKTGD